MMQCVLKIRSAALIQQKPNKEKAKLKNASNALHDRTVYSIPKTTSLDIVDLMLKIMDGDGPRPMRNMKPVQKNRNGADVFNDEHHARYEARERQSRSPIARVLAHNNACPKMYDELHKRWSTAHATKANMDTDNQKVLLPPKHFDPHRQCLHIKLKRSARDDAKRKKTSDSKYYRNRETKTKVSKSKQKRANRTWSGAFKFSKLWSDKGCQCTCYYLPAEKKSVATFHEEFPQGLELEAKPVVAEQDTLNNFENKDEITPSKVEVEKKEKRVKSDTDSARSGFLYTNSVPSLSTYNSYMSMEHEPMIE